MCKIILAIIICLFNAGTASSQNSSRSCAEKLIRQSIDAIGGEEAVKRLTSISYRVDGYRNLVEQSERPEGPAIPGIVSKDVVIDFAGKRMSQKQSSSAFLSGVNSYTIVDNHFLSVRWGNLFVPVSQNGLTQDMLETETIFVLFEALNSNALSCEKDTMLQSQHQNTVKFLWNGYPVRIFLSAVTHFITAVEVQKPYDDLFLNVWGDSHKITFFSFWYRLPNKVSYPMQYDTYINDWHYTTFLVDFMNVSINKPVGDSLVIPDSVLAKIKQLPDQPLTDKIKQQLINGKTEIAKDVWIIPGPCNSTILKQDQSVVIIEASSSSDYSAFIVDVAKGMYPGLPIKTVVSTSDAWLHMGGLREYAAIGSKIYCLDLNKWIIDKLLKSPYISRPDKWEKKADKNVLMQTVSKKTVIGSGTNRFELYPFKTETGERMMMAYFPEHKIIYASDLFQPKSRGGKYWNSHYTLEVVRAIQREKLEVKELYAMHSGILNYDEIKTEFE